jgi:hypothetical protein
VHALGRCWNTVADDDSPAQVEMLALLARFGAVAESELPELRLALPGRAAGPTRDALAAAIETIERAVRDRSPR